MPTSWPIWRKNSASFLLACPVLAPTPTPPPYSVSQHLAQPVGWQPGGLRGQPRGLASSPKGTHQLNHPAHLPCHTVPLSRSAQNSSCRKEPRCWGRRTESKEAGEQQQCLLPWTPTKADKGTSDGPWLSSLWEQGWGAFAGSTPRSWLHSS